MKEIILESQVGGARAKSPVPHLDLCVHDSQECPIGSSPASRLDCASRVVVNSARSFGLAAWVCAWCAMERAK
jgi:hypothetical protein